MKRLFHFLAVFLLLLVPFFLSTQHASAMDLRADEAITVNRDEKDIKNLYIFGEAVKVHAPVRYDVLSGGRHITIDGPVEGSINAAGENVDVLGEVGNSVRAAASDILIDSKITNDLIVAGGNVIISKSSSIGGDVIFLGGTLTVDGPVQGRILFNGGEVKVNSTVGGGMQGDVEELTLGPNAVINGDLKYTSSKPAKLAAGAQVIGKTIHTPSKARDQKDNQNSFLSGGAVYKLIVDILLSLLFIYFLGSFAKTVFARMSASPWKSAGIGLSFLIVFPIAAVIMLVLIWLGLAAFLALGLLTIFALFLAKIFIGWMVLHWYEKRQKKEYQLDWKAGIVGPVGLFILALIPVLGWLAALILFLIALGALVQEVISMIQNQKLAPKSVKKSS